MEAPDSRVVGKGIPELLLLPCANTLGHGQECLHAQSDGTHSGSYSGQTLFLGCALGQKQTDHANLCEASRKKPGPTWHSKHSHHIKNIILPRLSKIHRDIGCEGGSSALGGMDPLLDPVQHPQGWACNDNPSQVQTAISFAHLEAHVHLGYLDYKRDVAVKGHT